MDKQIYLGRQLLHGNDRYGQWVTEEIEGWDEPPAIRDIDEDRSLAHGSFNNPSFYAARTPTLDGVLFAEARTDALNARQALTAAVQLGLVVLSVADAGKTQWANVKLAGLEFTWLTNKVFRWQLRLKAPDPRKFGDANVYTLSPNQTLPMFHYGNADASPVFEVTGDMPDGYTLWGPSSKTFVVPTSVTSARRHSLDMSEGLLKVNGNNWTGQTANADLWTIPPGQQINVGLTTTGTGAAKVTVYDTYI